MTSLARRRLLHRRTADALRLDLDTGGRDDMSTIARIAGHERAAGRTTEAAAAYLEAADRAEAVFANRETIEHLEAALALGRPEPVAIHARIGELRARLGEYPAAIASPRDRSGTRRRRRAPEHRDAARTGPSAPRRSGRGGEPPRRCTHGGGPVTGASDPGPGRAESGGASGRRPRARVDRGTRGSRDGRVDGDPHGAGVAERLVGLVAQARAIQRRRASLRTQSVVRGRRPGPDRRHRRDHGPRLRSRQCGRARRSRRGRDARHRGVPADRRPPPRGRRREPPGRPAPRCRARARCDGASQARGRPVRRDRRRSPERDPGIWALAAW